MNFRPILRAFDPKLYDLLQPYRAKESEMPWAYSRSNPKGRVLSDDWGVVGTAPALQPWQKIPRLDRTYRPPLPFRQSRGKGRKDWMLGDPDYPLAPGTAVNVTPYTWMLDGKLVTQNLLQVQVDVAEDDGYAEFECFLDGEWRVVVKRWHKKIPFTNKMLKVIWGMRQDVTASPPAVLGGPVQSDWMAWFPEWGCTLVTVR